jgi:uncharacterized protein YeeX (DUF496 family)
MVDFDLGDIPTGTAANIAADLVKATHNKLKVLAFGTGEERALERCLEEAFTDLLQTLVEASNRERLDSAISALRFAIVKGDIAEALIETALHGRLDREWLQGRLTEAGLDGRTLPIDLDQALTRLVAGLEKALRREAATAGSPLHGRVQLADLFHLRCELYRSRVVLQDLSAWIKRHTAHALRYEHALQNYFLEYLGLPGQPRPFGGREDATRYLNRWLGDPGRPNKLMLAAPSGRGKSALLVHWARQLPEDWQVVFVPVSIRFGTAAERPFFPILAARLAEALGDRDRPAPEKADDAAYCRALAQEYLSQPLPEGRPLVLIIDGLDEAVGWTFNASFFPLLHPPGLKVVVSARLQAGDTGPEQWIGRLNWDSFAGLAEPWTLTPLTRDGIADVLRRMGAPLADFASDPDVLGHLERLTEGDPLLVRFYVEDLWTIRERVPLLRPEDLTSLTPGYKGYFDKWLKDQRILWGEVSPLDERARRMILTILACAKGPLERRDIKNILKRCLPAFDGSIAETLRDFQRFVIGDGSAAHGYVLSHSKLAEYFHSSPFLEEDEISAVETAFLDWGQETLRVLEEEKADPKSVSPYLVQFFSVHLKERAPHRLMTLVCDRWRQAWERFEGGYSGFANDVRRAWEEARRVDGVAGATSAVLMPRLGDQIRCALVLSSINCLGSNIPGELLALSVEVDELQPQQALNFALSDSDPKNRAYSLVDLASELPPNLRVEARAAAQAITDNGARAWALGGLVPYLPDHLKRETAREALKTVLALRDDLSEWGYNISHNLLRERPDELKVAVLRLVGKYLSSESKAEALSAVQRMWNREDRARALRVLAPYLPEELKANALAAAQAIEDEHSRAEALAALVPYLPVALAAEALVTVRLIKDEQWRAKVLNKLVPHLPEEFKKQAIPEALAASRAIIYEGHRASALAELALNLPENLCGEVFREALAAAREAGSAAASRSTGLGRNRWTRETLAWKRARALGELVLHLPEELRPEVAREVFTIVLQPDADGTCEWLAMSPLVHYQQADEAKAEVVAAIAPHLPDALKVKMLWAMRSIRDEWARAQALSALAPHLAEELKSDALAALLPTNGRGACAVALSELLPQLPDKLRLQAAQGALIAVQALTEHWPRAIILNKLAPHLPRNLTAEAVNKALAAARAVGDTHARGCLLNALAQHLGKNLGADMAVEALAATQAIAKDPDRFCMLARLVPHLPKELKAQAVREALDTMRVIVWHDRLSEIHGFYSVEKAVGELASHLPETLKAEALDAARTIKDEQTRAKALIRLVPYLPEELKGEAVREALLAAQAIDYDKSRVDVLIDLAPHLAAHLKSEALAVARALEDEAVRARMLNALAPYLPDTVRVEALGVARAIRDGQNRAGALCGLAPYLPEKQKLEVMPETLEAARAIGDERVRAQTLGDLADHLPEEKLKAQAVCEALNAARADRYEESRAESLGKLARHLTGGQRTQVSHEAIEAARAAGTTWAHRNSAAWPEALHWHRVTALRKLLPDLPEELRTTAVREALGEARLIEHDDERVEALGDLVEHLPKELKIEVAREIIAEARAFATWMQKTDVSALDPFMPEDANVRWAFEQEEKLARVLTHLAPHVSCDLKEEEVSIARMIKNKTLRAATLAALARNIFSELKTQAMHEAVAAAQLIENKKERAELLAVLPVLAEENNPKAFLEALECFSALQRADALELLPKWFPSIQELGGEGALIATWHATLETARWWP